MHACGKSGRFVPPWHSLAHGCILNCLCKRCLKESDKILDGPGKRNLRSKGPKQEKTVGMCGAELHALAQERQVQECSGLDFQAPK